MRAYDVFQKLINRNVINPVDDNSTDPGEYEPPLVKRRRLQKEKDASSNVDPAPMMDKIIAPANPHVAVCVKPVRRRLSFSTALPTQSMHCATYSSSDESDMDNPFTSDDESVDYDVSPDGSRKEYTDHSPICHSIDADGHRIEGDLTNCEPDKPTSNEDDEESAHQQTKLDLLSLSATFIHSAHFPLSPLPSTPSSAPPSTPSSAPPSTPSSAPPSTPSSAPPSTPSSAPPSTPSSAPPTTPSSAPPTTPSSAPPTSNGRVRNNLQRQKDKHPMLEAGHCRDRCFQIIGPVRRLSIHAEYWSRSYNERRNWLLNNRCRASPKRCEYSFTDENGFRVKVCAKFFLNTLGYTSNSVIKCLDKVSPENGLYAPTDKRGKHKPRHAMDDLMKETIDAHIESFHPSCSHYRRSHAPNRRYLAPDLTIRDMFSYFNDMNEGNKTVCYESYRQRVAMKGISFAKLGVEECEQCMAFKLHPHQDPNDQPDCVACQEQVIHVKKYTIGRIHYQLDSQQDPDLGSTVYVSADMQKVIMLPSMPGVKSCVFVNRLVVFHETFAPLGKQSEKTNPKQVLSILWHEAMSGRSAADVTSAFIKAISALAEDGKHVVIWCDNCSAQNKNWTLYTSIVRYLNDGNDDDTGPMPNCVTLKYLETGHTFLSADSFHGLVEKNLRKRKNIYNFNDFVSAVQTCGGAPKTIQMEPQDVRMWDKRLSSGKSANVPYMKNIQEAQFQRGSKKLYYKNFHDDPIFQECDFLMKKTQKEIDSHVNKPTHNIKVRGIPTWKKEGLIKTLGSMMPEAKVVFWKALPVNDKSLDLTENEDNE